MAPSTSTSSTAAPKRTRSSASSGTSGAASLKQGRLAFSSLKRSESTPSSGGKGKAAKGNKLIVSRADPVDSNSSGDSSSDEEIEVEGGSVIRTRAVGGLGMRRRAGSTKDVNARSEVDERATLNVKDRRWNKIYGQAKAKMGNVPAIHNEGVSKVHDILRVFDMSYEYGPCVGVTRLERWERAEAMGLNPPSEIRDILMTKEGIDKNEFAQCVLYGEV